MNNTIANDKLDKVYDLVEKVYIELQEHKKNTNIRFDGIDERLDGIDERLDSLDNRLTKVEIKIENEISQKLDSLFEGQQLTNERLDRMEPKLDEVVRVTADHELRIQALEAGRRRKTV